VWPPPLRYGAAMIKAEFDYKELERFALTFGQRADQVPYALALAMNRSADVTRNLLIKTTWPTHVVQRNNSFIAASLTTKDAKASKQSLSIEIYDKLGRGNLQLQAKGGTRLPKGANLAIPAGGMKRGPRGVPARLKPKALNVALKRKGLLFARDGRGRLKLMYVLKPATKVPKRVPFYEDFAASMQRELTRTIPLAMAKAMGSAR
jgi:hypothetical protein